MLDKTKISAYREKVERDTDRSLNRGGQFGTPYVQWWRPKVGEYRIRFLDATATGLGFCPISQHFRFNTGGTIMAVICQTVVEQRCPICELKSILSRSTKESERERAKVLSPTVSNLFVVLNMEEILTGKPSEKVIYKDGEFEVTRPQHSLYVISRPNSFLREYLAIADMEGIEDITSLTEGYDIRYKKNKTGPDVRNVEHKLELWSLMDVKDAKKRDISNIEINTWLVENEKLTQVTISLAQFVMRYMPVLENWAKPYLSPANVFELLSAEDRQLLLENVEPYTSEQEVDMQIKEEAIEEEEKNESEEEVLPLHTDEIDEVDLPKLKTPLSPLGKKEKKSADKKTDIEELKTRTLKVIGRKL